MSTAPSSNGVFVVIPPSNASGLRSPPAILPTSLCQPPGIMQYEEPPLGAQTPRVTQPPDLRPGETFLTGEPKALGTVQILIGLIHLGFGGVLLMVRRGHVGMLFIEGGVPFWGGACFIISGSLSVAAEKNHTSCLVRSSLGTNILSTMAAFAGTAILLMDFGVTNWVCCLTSPGVGKLEEEQQPIQEAARVGGREVVGPWASAEPANPKRPPGVYGPQDPTSRVGIVWGRGRVAEKQS
ncbi:membrane-spanning 4-domains subfamily A member 15 isoform X1 [Bubalus kerabau]|uniref:membrane-spanning 4-domains subfamily A member 15 isoform X1 n=1 Tax=Bubalus carabanensis TaxID=3119969 RepID=UPI00244EDF61|nr:membrane-spanning 4-domains subfamily A member 15 isoform X1 [Bubalus carabanensis]XP_055439372.1 membrane-spanning 4-domains subfamily A member 15 isoform X1 [Bubalus carabanensis]